MAEGADSGRTRLEWLDKDECLELVASGGVGRVAFNSQTGPVILPVNYMMDAGTILFRTALGGPLDTDLRTGVEGAEFKVAFEVDRIDEARREGWSVLVRGGAHHVTGEEECAQAAATGLETWAGGERELFIRIAPVEITGRRITRG
ncbi:pyridoxamine 5'-phosphate oxidase family protein [Sphaerimonospora cavernae]|uniref:Pyridoxamine 5'-phosphate oxidase family protein n=1 Tax=Sphaerimonospora cavernae TaxID=1740611 RepID=A0ABV6U715_9ACTN